ncbi:MAG: hypothetical protein E6G97_15915 [Alphaproteobacteria bacterium]|nr:MAG: hypothetical protein E6G97_15915 [Alphaproteobacteria bacterium]
MRKFLPAAIVGALLAFVTYAAPAHAQATRTWVSGVGNDADPCSRTAPCKTFAGAISKTAAGGEINCIDGNGAGAVTITKSLTIDGGGTFCSILAAGITGVNISTTAGIKVVLRNISIDGAGSGINGVSVNIGSTVLLENVQIFGFTNNGINTSSLTQSATIQAKNVSFEYINGTAALFQTSGGFAVGQITGASFLGVTNGVTAGTNGFVTVSNSSFVGSTTAAQASGNGTLNVDTSLFSNNTNAVTAGVGTNVRVSNNALYDNPNGFTINGTMVSDGKNRVIGGATASPPTTLPLK